MDIYLHTSILSHITSKAQKNLNFLEKGAINSDTALIEHANKI